MPLRIASVDPAYLYKKMSGGEELKQIARVPSPLGWESAPASSILELARSGSATTGRAVKTGVWLRPLQQCTWVAAENSLLSIPGAPWRVHVQLDMVLCLVRPRAPQLERSFAGKREPGVARVEEGHV